MDSFKRTGNISSHQKMEIMKCMEENPQLISSKFLEFITEKLNSLPVAHKDWKQWRVVIYVMLKYYS